jgi:hypothetical protein
MNSTARGLMAEMLSSPVPCRSSAHQLELSIVVGGPIFTWPHLATALTFYLVTGHIWGSSSTGLEMNIIPSCFSVFICNYRCFSNHDQIQHHSLESSRQACGNEPEFVTKTLGLNSEMLARFLIFKTMCNSLPRVLNGSKFVCRCGLDPRVNVVALPLVFFYSHPPSCL